MWYNKFMIYLDYSANHPVREEVLETFVSTEKRFYGNANSFHVEGKASKEEFDRLQASMYSLLRLDPKEYEIIHTSSATESNNTVIKGVYDSYSGFGKQLLASEFEHSSVNVCLSYLKDKGAEVSLIDTEKDGKLSLSDLKEKLRSDTLLVTCPLIESEVGTIQDYQGIQKVVSTFAHAHFLLDATQAVGKIPVDFSGIDFVSFAPHKFGGIIGTGVLIKKRNLVLTPLLHGGKSASIYRSSTLPLGLVASTEKALSLALREQNEHYQKVSSLSKRLREGLSSLKGILINSGEENPYILNLSVIGKRGGDTVSYFSDHGICISQKSACSVLQTPSKPVMAIYHDKKRALSSVRISLSYLTKEEEIDTFVAIMKEYLHE